MTDQIVNLLKTERDRIDAAILALRGEKRRGRPPKMFNLAPANVPLVKDVLFAPTPIRQRPGQIKRKRRAWTAKEKAQI